MKKIYLSLVCFSPSFISSMNETVHVTLADNQKIELTTTQLKRLVQSSKTLKNAAEDLNDEQLPTDFPFIENPTALIRITDLLNDDGTPKEDSCKSQTKDDWYTMAPALEYLHIECLNPYLLETLENAYSSETFCTELLQQDTSQPLDEIYAAKLSFETLAQELIGSINKKNVVALTKYSFIKTLQGHERGVSAIAITPDGQTLVSGSYKTFNFWNLSTGELRQTLHGHEHWVTALNLTSDGQTLISGSHDRTIKLWDPTSGSLQKTLEGHREGVTAIDITHDNQTLVSGSGDKTIKIWNLNISEPLHTLQDHTDSVTAVAISPDNKTIVSSSYDNSTKIWNLTTGKYLRTLPGHKSAVRAVAISPDNKTIVVGSNDTTITIWGLQSGLLKQTLQGHKDWVNAVAITPDGQIIISGSNDKTIKLWDLHTGKKLQTLKGHTGWVTPVAITPDGQTLASGSWDKTIKLWQSNLSPELKKELLQVPLEQAVVIQALRIRPNLQEPFELVGKSREHFQQLDPGIQNFLAAALNIEY